MSRWAYAGLKCSPRAIRTETLRYGNLVSFVGKMWISEPRENATILPIFGIFRLESFHHQDTFWSLPFPSTPADVPTVYTHGLAASHFKAGLFLNIFKGKTQSSLSSHQRKKKKMHLWLPDQKLVARNDYNKPHLFILIGWLVKIKMPDGAQLGGRFPRELGMGAVGHHPISHCCFSWFLNSLSGCYWERQVLIWP